jgi:hypothetical protein
VSRLPGRAASSVVRRQVSPRIKKCK